MAVLMKKKGAIFTSTYVKSFETENHRDEN